MTLGSLKVVTDFSEELLYSGYTFTLNSEAENFSETLLLSHEIILYYVRFEVSTAVTMMIIIFWEMTPCGSYKNRRFGGSYRLHH
jgi:hypothetical protein